jgi:hypothetical protein
MAGAVDHDETASTAIDLIEAFRPSKLQLHALYFAKFEFVAQGYGGR